MNRWQICWILGASLLTACSSQELILPTCDIPAPMKEVGLPVRVPEMPSAVRETEEEATFDRAGVVVLTQVRVAAVTNNTVARENAAAIAARNDEVNQLIECARYSRIWMEIREDEIRQERKDHLVDNIKHLTLIAAGVIAVIW